MQDIIHFFGNTIWQTIFAFISIVLMTMFFLKQRAKKEIAYRITSDVEELRVRKEIEHKVKITFDTKPVKNVKRIVLKIWNSGDLSICPNDYIEPITLRFNKNAEILDAKVLGTVPDNIEMTIKFDAEKVILDRPYLTE